MKYCFSVFFLMLLVACGGGDSGDDSGNSSVSTPSTGPTPATKTADLSTTEEFDFSTHKTVMVAVDLTNAALTPMLLNICTSYVEKNAQVIVDQSSCVVKQKVSGTYYEYSMELSNHQQSLAVQLWQSEPELTNVTQILDVSDNIASSLVRVDF